MSRSGCTRRPLPDPRLGEALAFQRRAFDSRTMSSPLYAAVLDAVTADVERGGPCRAVFDRAPAGLDPIPDALVLRFLGALHRIVLTCGAPELARWYPTAGGRFDASAGDDPAPDVVTAVEAHADELVEGLSLGVQTNEVGRCAALVVGFAALLRRYRLPLRLLEVGTSAGLNLRWGRWRYESGETRWGDADARLRFGDDVYREPFPDVDAPLGPDAAVAERHGCDRSPIDPRTEEGRLLLRSFVWPDQAERYERLDAALAVAADVPASVERRDAAEFVAAHLAGPASGRTTVVFHSIVWQYLPPSSREGVLSSLDAAGAGATADAPIAWLRMEPPPDVSARAAVRLATWDAGGRDERLLARSGYHGRPVRG